MLTACSAAPPEGSRTYVCYTQPGEPSFQVDFEGQAAVVRLGARAQRLERQPAGVLAMEETYAGDGVRLTLDPEANLYGMTPQRLGPCQSEP